MAINKLLVFLYIILIFGCRSTNYKLIYKYNLKEIDSIIFKAVYDEKELVFPKGIGQISWELYSADNECQTKLRKLTSEQATAYKAVSGESTILLVYFSDLDIVLTKINRESPFCPGCRRLGRTGEWELIKMSRD